MVNFFSRFSRRLGLQNNEKQLLEDVYYETIREIELSKQNGKEIDEKLFQQIVEVIDHLGNITDNLDKCVSGKRKFLHSYPVFSEVREKNIKGLEDLGKSLNLDRKNSNIARLVGNVVSFVGGSTVVVSAALIPITFGLSAPLAIAGASAVAAGSATSVGTSVTELALRKNKVERANTIIEEDKKALNDFADWFRPACELTEALDRVSQIDLMRDMMDALREFIDQAIKIKQGGKRNEAVKILVKAALAFLPGDLERVVEFVAVLISMLSAIIMLHDRNRLIFDCASLTLKSALAILSCVDSCIDGGVTVAQLVCGNANVAKSVGKVVVRSTFAAFGMTLDVASIVLTSIDVHKGSNSKEGLLILEAAKKLREQADMLQKMFKDLQH